MKKEKHSQLLTLIMVTKIKNKNRIRFKEYDQSQVMLLPIEIEKLIPQTHLVRIVDKVVEGIDIRQLEAYYIGIGCPPYHPRMMIKVWIYGYCEQIYTSRRLAKALRENINFIWLSGNQQPCFKSLSEFRSVRMKELIDVVFEQVLFYLVEHGYIDLEDLFVDGTKLAANANKYKRVWAKNTVRYKAAVLERIRALLAQIDQWNAEEDERYGLGDLPEVEAGQGVDVTLSSAQLEEHIISLNEMIVQRQVQSRQSKAGLKKQKSRVKALAKEAEKLAKYEEQERLLGGRNSYSRTDTDATMLRMKDDQLLPGYNLQGLTNNQYMVHFSVHQQASDSVTLPSHLEQLQTRHQCLAKPEKQTFNGDAGYGSEENYEQLEQGPYEAYVKYGTFYQEQSGQLAKKPFHRQNFTYQEQGDYFLCPDGRRLTFAGWEEKKTANGYLRRLKVYRCESCADCPFAPACKKPEAENRTVRFSPKLEAYKEQARQRLTSEKGLDLRSRRGFEIETFFGDLKFNRNYRRFILRGLDLVYIELGILAVAYNLRKVYCAQSGIWARHYANRARKRA